MMDTNQSPRKTLGRGQALQSVRAGWCTSVNPSMMHMSDYTNEKIMEFLDKLSERYDRDEAELNPVTSRPSIEVEKDEIATCKTSGSENQRFKIHPASRHSSINQRSTVIDSRTLQMPANIPGQFTLRIEDFPPLSLCQSRKCMQRHRSP